MVLRCVGPLKARGNIKCDIPAKFRIFHKGIVELPGILVSSKYGKVGIGTLKTINNPLELLSFGTAGAQDGGNSIYAWNLQKSHSLFDFLENFYKIDGKVAFLRFWEVFGQKWRPGIVEMHRNYLCSGMPLRRSFFV